MTIHASSRFLVVCKHLITKNERYYYKARSNDVICDNKTLKSTLKNERLPPSPSSIRQAILKVTSNYQPPKGLYRHKIAP